MEERWREPAALAEQYAGMLYRLAYAAPAPGRTRRT